jgi:peptidyl-prolyl cis-trans isomerase C
MLNTGKFAALAILGVLATGSAFAEDQSAAVVNGVAIPQARVDMIVKAVVASQGQTDTPELRKAVRENLIIKELVVQEVHAKGLDKQPEVLEQIENTRQEILINAFQLDYAKNHPISEDKYKEEYDKLRVNLGNKEYKARHILVDTEDEAKAIIAQLAKKGKFDKIEREIQGCGLGSKGRRTRLVGAGQLRSAFCQCAARPEKGQLHQRTGEIPIRLACDQAG